MTTNINALAIRRQLDPHLWKPPQQFGDDGWILQSRDQQSSVIVTVADHDAAEWIHASIAHRTRIPQYGDMVRLHAAVWADRGYAYQVFPPPSAHVNIHPNALHLWGRLDGTNVLPDFAWAGMI